MKRLLVFYILFALVAAFLCPSVFSGENNGDLAKAIIPLDKPSEILTTASNAVRETMGVIRPKETGVSGFVTSDKRCVLYGRLFKGKENYALLEVPPPPSGGERSVAFARWSNGSWVLSGVWDIHSDWRPKGWKPQQKNENEIADDWLPIEHPAERAFFLQPLDGTGVPEVVIAGEVLKYFQNYYILRFDPKATRLALVGDAMARPEYVGEYVRLYYASERRSEWEQWDFCKWNGLALVKEASWRDETPYRDPDKSFTEASRRDGQGKFVTYRVEEESASNDGLMDSYKVTLDAHGTAKVIFHERKLSNPTSDAYAVEDKYFFERLTGLSGALYPRNKTPKELKELRDSTVAPPMAIENVTVTGETELVKVLSFKP